MKKLLLALALWPTLAWGQAAPIVLTEGNRPTYCSGILDAPGAGGAGADLLYVQGSATKAIRIVSTEVSGIATAATVTNGAWFKRTTAYTGGATSAAAISKSDSTDPTAAGAFLLVTAATTGGTFAGYTRAFKFMLGTTASAPLPYAHTYGRNNERAVVLRGVAEFFAFQMTAIPAGLALNANVCWVEE